ncbi:hypothetical protein OCV73_02175 [Barnesiella propionica]|uniref:FAD-binding oxidoreductase n=1 Tax=Barnesiella propionica TaxID=2981781 RepID=UPI0011CBB671|nr:FAD-binding oxidoreductase [Barnesiella propionica]MCU6767766.1 hypothetical protein [Barnesiella propionica]
MNDPLSRDLSGFLSFHQIFYSELYREIYVRDASYFNMKPKVIVRPETTDRVHGYCRQPPVTEGE